MIVSRQPNYETRASPRSSLSMAAWCPRTDESQDKTMKNILAALLPVRADNTIRGMKLPVYVFTLISIVSLIRSSIHLLAPDGGAGSIAGMNLSVAGADPSHSPQARQRHG